MQGYIKDYRKELDSDIWMMPPLYHRVWQYLKYKVNHKIERIPMKDGSFLTVKPGQHLTSKRKLAQSVGWYERMVWKEPNPKTISDILKWLEKQKMIEQDLGAGNRQYTLISLLNWEVYQSKEDESNTTDLHQNPENGVNGNTLNTEKSPSNQDKSDGKGVTSNSHYTPDKQSLETNKNEKNEEEDVVVDSAQARTQEQQFEKQLDQITDAFMAYRGKPGMPPRASDYDHARAILEAGVSATEAIAGIKQSFDIFKPKYDGDEITSLGYCKKIILANHYADKQRKEATERGQTARSYGEPANQGGGSQKRSITGGQLGWIRPGKQA
ncbi:glutamyl/glutaminyl-tRNA synthetase [Salibacterium salarium]|uniref:hypothetical protein n=1 Tax=Salibacterium salarium TaxID=284579 RepID=UPI002784EEE0|nr:hypothetical protein [Salibacterium salarium]MDQ0299675.1 glutamyl/glutaminyl-tRNA synthetase [Salibacterium salarium]